jgi:hypothetical protein
MGAYSFSAYFYPDCLKCLVTALKICLCFSETEYMSHSTDGCLKYAFKHCFVIGPSAKSLNVF